MGFGILFRVALSNVADHLDERRVRGGFANESVDLKTPTSTDEGAEEEFDIAESEDGNDSGNHDEIERPKGPYAEQEPRQKAHEINSPPGDTGNHDGTSEGKSIAPEARADEEEEEEEEDAADGTVVRLGLPGGIRAISQPAPAEMASRRDAPVDISDMPGKEVDLGTTEASKGLNGRGSQRMTAKQRRQAKKSRLADVDGAHWSKLGVCAKAICAYQFLFLFTRPCCLPDFTLNRYGRQRGRRYCFEYRQIYARSG